MSNSKSSSGGIDLSASVFIVFLVLKLCGVIHWSWWWVTAPLWAPLVLVLAIGAVALLIYGASKALGLFLEEPKLLRKAAAYPKKRRGHV